MVDPGTDEACRAIEEARLRLGLGHSASLAEVQQAYRARAQELHPDRWPAERREWCQAEMAGLNSAYETIRAYCSAYRFSLDPADVRREVARRDPYAFWLSRFGP